MGKDPFYQIIKKSPTKDVFVHLLEKYLDMNAGLWSGMCVWSWIFENFLKMSGTSSDSKCQRVVEKVIKSDNEGKRVTTCGITSDNKWQQMTSDNEWQRATENITTSDTTIDTTSDITIDTVIDTISDITSDNEWYKEW